MTLSELELKLGEYESCSLPTRVDKWIRECQGWIQGFWDRYPRGRDVEWVECDYEFVARVLMAALDNGWIREGERFLEWGCGFAVIAGVADLMGFDALGVDIEDFMVAEGRQLHFQFGLTTQLETGNFLPNGARELLSPSDPRISGRHTASEVYGQLGTPFSMFDVVFCYAWPGEEHFIKHVFDRFGSLHQRLLLYRGPFHLECYQHLGTT